MWETRCSELSESSNNETCNHADSCLDEILFEIQNSEASALSACCAFGGGFRAGKSILMEDQSPIRCRVLNSSSDIIVCECSDETQRYDIVTSSCISSCPPGERWESVISDPYDSINSDAGRCVPCLAGTWCSSAYLFSHSLTPEDSLVSLAQLSSLSLFRIPHAQ